MSQDKYEVPTGGQPTPFARRLWLWLVHFLHSLGGYLSALIRDLSGLISLVEIESRIYLNEKRNTLLADAFRIHVRKNPDKPCLIFEKTTWTFQEVEDYSNRIAELFVKKFDLKKGDCVVLFMETKPEYVCVMLGLSKIGVISSLVNTYLRNQQLSHCINASQPKLIICGNDLAKFLDDIRTDLNSNIITVFEQERDLEQTDRNANTSHTTSQLKFGLKELVRDHTTGKVVEPAEKILTTDALLYIFTSGTTGLPKPAIIKQNRYVPGAFVFFILAHLNTRDVVLVTLPIYHSNGIMIGVGAALVSGATVVLKRKFSASNFWKDCIEHRCSAFIYVGEICRFLVNQPASPLDRAHYVRVAIGNGMRSNVWPEFNRRFNIKCLEFYAASEGNCIMGNSQSVSNRIGPCGFVPLFTCLRSLLPIRLVRVDEEQNLIRDARGFCIPCKPHEKGLLVGIIGRRPKTAFSGYANNSKETSKKIVDPLFKPGQRAFNTGDLMVMDELGFLYFCDRTGDTYRWRGENVSTVEVECVVSKRLDSAEVVVYGVEIPGQEGKAGMAAIRADQIDAAHLSETLPKELTAYAMPLFLRLVSEVEHTSTFKAKKNRLVEQGFDLQKCERDSVYFWEGKEKAYRLLSEAVYEEILSGSRRF